MERERIGPGRVDDFGDSLWDEDRGYGDHNFDGDGDRQSPAPNATSTPDGNERKPDPKTAKKSGRAATSRIGNAQSAEAQATPQGPGNPMRDRKVIAELKQAAADESRVDFPYTATVTTVRDPLRLRASASLSATIITRMPKGSQVTVTGHSSNHFRPVKFIDPTRPDKPWTGFAFTTYLSPPKLKPDVKPKPVVDVGEIATVTVHGEEEPIELIPTAQLITEITLRPVDALVTTPAKSEPALANTDAAIAGRVVDDMKRLNGATPSLTSGLHYKDSYKLALDAAGRSKDWDRRWEMGHTASALWEQPYDNDDPMTFTLKLGTSASEGLRQWIAGLTVADCTVAMVAIELDAVRAVVGDKLFDRCFGTPSGKARIRQLKLSQRLSDTPLYELLRFTDGALAAQQDKSRGELGKRPVKTGEWYYFANASDYEFKHPAGPWRGENALCLGDEGGKQSWSGLGATYDEEGMLRALVTRYNAPRTEEDYAWLDARYSSRDNWAHKYTDGFAAVGPKVTPTPNDGPRDQVDLEAIVAAQKAPPTNDKKAPPKKQTVGLNMGSGMVLSTAKLADLVRTYGDDEPTEVDPSDEPL